MKRLTLLVLCAAILVCSILTGCSSKKASFDDIANDLMKGITPQKSNAESVSLGGDEAVSPMDFSVRLFQKSVGADDNAMISPMSVLYALAMTANGAKGDTLAQMEAAFGMPVSDLNIYLKAYRDALPETRKNKLRIANSIWFTDDESFSVERLFLQANADYYGSDIYKAPFNEDTRKNINLWVEESTDGMIADILDNIPSESVMYLINAIAFDAEWKEIYKDTQIRDGVFTTETGEKQKVTLMHSREHLYLEDRNATGFMKPYTDSQYAFVALLPKEGLRVREYVDSLTGEGLAALLADPQQTAVNAALTKFENEYSAELNEILAAMGMKDAFDANAADFTGLGNSSVGHIFISHVLHKTFIAVDEKGTKAGAATVVDVATGTDIAEEPKEVILDRPFVYMIVDREAKLPLFMGVQMENN